MSQETLAKFETITKAQLEISKSGGTQVFWNFILRSKEFSIMGGLNFELL